MFLELFPLSPRSICVVRFGAQGLGRTATFLPTLRKSIRTATELFAMLDRESAIPTDSGLIPEGLIQGKIEFKDVNFNHSQEPALKVNELLLLYFFH